MRNDVTLFTLDMVRGRKPDQDALDLLNSLQEKSAWDLKDPDLSLTDAILGLDNPARCKVRRGKI